MNLTESIREVVHINWHKKAFRPFIRPSRFHVVLMSIPLLYSILMVAWTLVMLEGWRPLHGEAKNNCLKMQIGKILFAGFRTCPTHTVFTRESEPRPHARNDLMTTTLHKDSSESELTGHVVEAFELEKRRRITVDFPDDSHFAQKKRAALIAAAIDAMFTAAATTRQRDLMLYR
ncbi:hypothetical protein PFISCL1PPCAC_24765 [Pristionchus fissidentatus]|uniref:G protein-coupled receptor n=1 Tax=Pristionchus fissidentatus TaxID=1538716 RepID=A0AAV5WMF2_9BILA|nr:hypothetical protein PFISCL1PPCAC_24763 [Pristionchus fissidentatus]GMT33468.1 hypothetical protein PFISCL1PPCAC_24765 [Pristionchus fissidentatus]